jgi:VanZ family protein
MCGLPGNEFPDLSFWELLTFDKAAHIFVFAVLSLLLITGFLKQYRFPRLRSHAVLSAVLMSLSYGILLEGLQSAAFSDRSGDVMDAVANTIGSVAGAGVSVAVYGKEMIFKK